jgi:hypothetical protein
MVFLAERGDGDPSWGEPESLPVLGRLLNGLHMAVLPGRAFPGKGNTPVFSNHCEGKKGGGKKE